MSRLRQMKGFTLIELIVVVIIIGVLAAIAAVAYNQFVGNSRATAILASAKQVDKAIQAQTAQDDVSVTAAGELAKVTSVSGATVTAGTTAGDVKVVVGTRSACLVYGATPAAGAAATINTFTDTNAGGTC